MDYTPEYQPMLCGSADAESRKYHQIKGKSGKIWLYADQNNAADNIYVEGGPKSEGFGGRELTFPLVDGGEIKLRGPWHANADALFEDTDLDLRTLHLTFGCVGEGRKGDTITDVIYIDPSPQIGPFDRIERIAKELASLKGMTLYYYAQSQGGSSTGPVQPEVK